MLRITSRNQRQSLYIRDHNYCIDDNYVFPTYFWWYFNLENVHNMLVGCVCMSLVSLAWSWSVLPAKQNTTRCPWSSSHHVCCGWGEGDGYGKILFTNFLSSGWAPNKTRFSIETRTFYISVATTTYLVAVARSFILTFSFFPFTLPPLCIKTDRHSTGWCWCAKSFSHNSSYVRLNLRVFVFQVCNITRLRFTALSPAQDMLNVIENISQKINNF